MSAFFEYHGECHTCDRELSTRVPKGLSESNPGDDQWCRCGECGEIRCLSRQSASLTLSTEAAP